MCNWIEVLTKHSKQIKKLLADRFSPEEIQMLSDINSWKVKLVYGNIEQTALIRKSELVEKFISIWDVYGIVWLLNEQWNLKAEILSDKIRDEYNP